MSKTWSFSFDKEIDSVGQGVEIVKEYEEYTMKPFLIALSDAPSVPLKTGGHTL